MKSLPPNRRAALIASLSAITASSTALLARHGDGAPFHGADFLLGGVFGVAIGLAVVAIIKLRPR